MLIKSIYIHGHFLDKLLANCRVLFSAAIKNSFSLSFNPLIISCNLLSRSLSVVFKSKYL